MTGPPRPLGDSPRDARWSHGATDPAPNPVGAPNRQPTGLAAGPAKTTIDHATASEDPKRRPPPPWSSPREGLVLIARGYTFRTGVAVASVVGTILSGVNEGTVIASGHIGVSTWARVATNYLVPFVVASIGYLAPFRHPRGTSQ